MSKGAADPVPIVDEDTSAESRAHPQKGFFKDQSSLGNPGAVSIQFEREVV
jgi:hypothetical protein